MYDRDNLQCMIDCLEENRYAYTNYSHRNGCCSINSDLLLKQLKLNEKEIRAKAIDEFAEKVCDRVSELSERCIFPQGETFDILTLDCVTDVVFEVAEELKGGAE